MGHRKYTQDSRILEFMQVLHLMSCRERGKGVGRREGGKQKKGWIGIGRNRWIGEKGRMKGNVCISSLRCVSFQRTLSNQSKISFFQWIDSEMVLSSNEVLKLLRREH